MGYEDKDDSRGNKHTNHCMKLDICNKNICGLNKWVEILTDVQKIVYDPRVTFKTHNSMHPDMSK